MFDVSRYDIFAALPIPQSTLKTSKSGAGDFGPGAIPALGNVFTLAWWEVGRTELANLIWHAVLVTSVA